VCSLTRPVVIATGNFVATFAATGCKNDLYAVYSVPKSACPILSAASLCLVG
jgi:hypothetical protein